MRLYSYLLYALLVCGGLQAEERIRSFEADITVHEDSTITIKEIIKVASEGRHIKHGIVREFPTKYTGKWGTRASVPFDVVRVLHNGRTVEYAIEKKMNGAFLYIGSPHVRLPSGNYTYTITYKTGRHIGFFDDLDELYWNVTGNGWRLPIDQVRARVHLPKSIPSDEIRVEAYTGYAGQKGIDYVAAVNAGSVAQFSTTRPLQPKEGLTIVTAWPKGYIAAPTALQKFEQFFADNIEMLLFLLGLFLIFVIFYCIRRKNKQLEGDRPIIPLFYPPEGMSPGLVNYIANIGHTNKAFTADIVNMAVHGWLEIEYKKGFMFGGAYTLVKKKSKGIAKYPLYTLMQNSLFFLQDSLELSKAHASTITTAQSAMQSEYEKKAKQFFRLNTGWWTAAIAIAFFCALGIGTSIAAFGLISGIIYAAVLSAGYYMLKSYTIEGFEIKREIEGFKYFLTATEQERMKLIGTPPTRNPQLYEKYLPYAIALGVEQAWARAFDAVFARLRQEGKPYVPLWYHGSLRGFNPAQFGSSMARGINSAISSSSTAPGSSRGFGGRGSSGGGGGGGGGGGW